MRMQDSSKAIKITWDPGLVGRRGYIFECGTSRRLITSDGLDTEYMDDDAPDYVCKTGLSWKEAVELADQYRQKNIEE